MCIAAPSSSLFNSFFPFYSFCIPRLSPRSFDFIIKVFLEYALSGMPPEASHFSFSSKRSIASDAGIALMAQLLGFLQLLRQSLERN